jgi:dimeric dUTPase (all-alpha-NTP-PPase superfamily)
MNLENLFKMQKVLMDRINYNEPDRFEKTILALLVEVGECANCWRGFKYWSKNQEPRTVDYKFKVFGSDTTATRIPTNPLLEEYVDGLHFVLQIGLELGYNENKCHYEAHHKYQEDDIEGQFLAVYKFALAFTLYDQFHALFHSYIYLGKMLGFTWEQIEQAYMDKNKVNHQRQEQGY